MKALALTVLDNKIFKNFLPYLYVKSENQQHRCREGLKPCDIVAPSSQYVARRYVMSCVTLLFEKQDLKNGSKVVNRQHVEFVLSPNLNRITNAAQQTSNTTRSITSHYYNKFRENRR